MHNKRAPILKLEVFFIYLLLFSYYYFAIGIHVKHASIY